MKDKKRYETLSARINFMPCPDLDDLLQPLHERQRRRALRRVAVSARGAGRLERRVDVGGRVLGPTHGKVRRGTVRYGGVRRRMQRCTINGVANC
jgi:hypothetical protein